MRNIRIDQIANISIFLILVILSWCFKASYFSYALIVFALFLIVDGIYSLRKKCSFFPKRSRPFCLMIAGILGFYLLFILTAVLHGNRLDWVKSLDYAELCIPFFTSWWILSKYDAEKGFHWGILVGAMIACCIGLYQWHINPGVRIKSSYAHPNHFGTMINFALPILGYYVMKIKQHAYKVLSLLTIIMQLVCLYLTGSRGAVLALVGAVILGMLWTYISLKKYKVVKFNGYVWGLIIVLLVGGGLVLHHMGQERNVDVIELAEKGESITRAGGERVQMIQASIAMWEDHKLLGVGAGHWGEEYYGQYRPADVHEKGHSMPHNMLLFFLSTSGIVGFAGYGFFVIMSAVTLTQLVKMKKDPGFALAVYMIFLSFFLQGFVDTTIINKIPARMYFALMGSFIPLGYMRLKKK